MDSCIRLMRDRLRLGLGLGLEDRGLGQDLDLDLDLDLKTEDLDRTWTWTWLYTTLFHQKIGSTLDLLQVFRRVLKWLHSDVLWHAGGVLVIIYHDVYDYTYL